MSPKASGDCLHRVHGEKPAHAIVKVSVSRDKIIKSQYDRHSKPSLADNCDRIRHIRPPLPKQSKEFLTITQSFHVTPTQDLHVTQHSEEECEALTLDQPLYPKDMPKYLTSPRQRSFYNETSEKLDFLKRRACELLRQRSLEPQRDATNRKFEVERDQRTTKRTQGEYDATRPYQPDPGRRPACSEEAMRNPPRQAQPPPCPPTGYEKAPEKPQYDEEELKRRACERLLQTLAQTVSLSGDLTVDDSRAKIKKKKKTKKSKQSKKRYSSESSITSSASGSGSSSLQKRSSADSFDARIRQLQKKCLKECEALQRQKLKKQLKDCKKKRKASPPKKKPKKKPSKSATKMTSRKASNKKSSMLFKKPVATKKGSDSSVVVQPKKCVVVCGTPCTCESKECQVTLEPKRSSSESECSEKRSRVKKEFKDECATTRGRVQLRVPTPPPRRPCKCSGSSSSDSDDSKKVKCKPDAIVRTKRDPRRPSCIDSKAKSEQKKRKIFCFRRRLFQRGQPSSTTLYSDSDASHRSKKKARKKQSSQKKKPTKESSLENTKKPSKKQSPYFMIPKECQEVLKNRASAQSQIPSDDTCKPRAYIRTPTPAGVVKATISPIAPKSKKELRKEHKERIKQLKRELKAERERIKIMRKVCTCPYGSCCCCYPEPPTNFKGYPEYDKKSSGKLSFYDCGCKMIAANIKPANSSDARNDCVTENSSKTNSRCASTYDGKSLPSRTACTSSAAKLCKIFSIKKIKKEMSCLNFPGRMRNWCNSKCRAGRAVTCSVAAGSITNRDSKNIERPSSCRPPPCPPVNYQTTTFDKETSSGVWPNPFTGKTAPYPYPRELFTPNLNRSNVSLNRKTTETTKKDEIVDTLDILDELTKTLCRKICQEEYKKTLECMQPQPQPADKCNTKQQVEELCDVKPSLKLKKKYKVQVCPPPYVRKPEPCPPKISKEWKCLQEYSHHVSGFTVAVKPPHLMNEFDCDNSTWKFRPVDRYDLCKLRPDDVVYVELVDDKIPPNEPPRRIARLLNCKKSDKRHVVGCKENDLCKCEILYGMFRKKIVKNCGCLTKKKNQKFECKCNNRSGVMYEVEGDAKSYHLGGFKLGVGAKGTDTTGLKGICCFNVFDNQMFNFDTPVSSLTYVIYT